MNHSCQQKIYINNILCIAKKLVLLSKVTVHRVFSLIQLLFLKGWEIFFQEPQSGELRRKIMFQCMLDVSRKLLRTKSMAVLSISQCLPIAIFIALYLFNRFICFVQLTLTDS